MKREQLANIIRISRDIAEIERGIRLCGIEGNRVHLASEEYEVTFPDYRDHTAEMHGGHIKISHEQDGVEIFALFTPQLKGGIKDML